MRSARHRLIAVPLGLALSLAFAGVASAAGFTMPSSVAPNQNFTVTPSLNAAELLDAQVVRFRFSDTQVIEDDAAPVDEAKTFGGYGTAGRKTVTMQIEYLVAADEFVSHAIRVNAAPVGAFTRSVTVPNVGQAVSFDATPSTDDQENGDLLGDGETAVPLPNSAYSWDFDDNGTYEQIGQTVQRTFATPGDKLVRLRVTDGGGRTDVVPVTVHVNRPPVSRFLFASKTPRVNDLVEFTSVSDDPDDPITLEQWDLDGDGQYDDANGSTTSRRFTTAGNHVVRLRVRDSRGRTDTSAQTIIVAALPPTPPPERMRPWPRIRIVGFAGATRVRAGPADREDGQGRHGQGSLQRQGLPAEDGHQHAGAQVGRPRALARAQAARGHPRLRGHHATRLHRTLRAHPPASQEAAPEARLVPLSQRAQAPEVPVTGLRQLVLVLVLGLASFGALFAAAKADSDSSPVPSPAVKPAAKEAAPAAATVSVADLGRAEPLPAMRERKPRAGAGAGAGAGARGRDPGGRPGDSRAAGLHPAAGPYPRASIASAERPGPELRRLRLIR